MDIGSSFGHGMREYAGMQLLKVLAILQVGLMVCACDAPAFSIQLENPQKNQRTNCTGRSFVKSVAASEAEECARRYEQDGWVRVIAH